MLKYESFLIMTSILVIPAINKCMTRSNLRKNLFQRIHFKGMQLIRAGRSGDRSTQVAGHIISTVSEQSTVAKEVSQSYKLQYLVHSDTRHPNSTASKSHSLPKYSHIVKYWEYFTVKSQLQKVVLVGLNFETLIYQLWSYPQYFGCITNYQNW